MAEAAALRLDKFLWFARLTKTRALAQALHDGLCDDPFAVLGPHPLGHDGFFRLRVYAPGSHSVTSPSMRCHRTMMSISASWR